jgi:murein L,D-transpeptidase YafK
MIRRILYLFALFLVGLGVAYFAAPLPTREVIRSEVARRVPALRSTLSAPRQPIEDRLRAKGFALGQPVLLRVFKEESVLEVWLKNGETYALFDTYDICKWSGDLGPKLLEGDGQSPEGFYFASVKQLLPTSRYHRAINTGFPNAFDAGLGRTGSVLMVHGSCVSIGCYAMTDPGIDDIYKIVEASLNANNSPIAMHLLPFRMSSENLSRHHKNRWIDFWKNLAEGDAIFTRNKLPPEVFACGGKYVFGTAAASCTPVTAW